MKKVLFVSLAALFVLGCASRATEMKLSAADEEIAALKAEIAALKKPAPAAPAPTPSPSPAAMMPPGYVPPAHAPVRSVPENWFWLYEEPAGCADGPLAIDIANWTGQDIYLALMIDGKGIQVRGGYGPLPHIPPGQTVHGCLDSLGGHVITGEAYVMRYNELRKIGDVYYSGNFTRMEKHIVILSDKAIKSSR